MKKTATLIILLTLFVSGRMYGQGSTTPIHKPNRTAYIIGPLQVSCGDLATYSFSTGAFPDNCYSVKWTVSDTNGRYETYSGETIQIAVSPTWADMVVQVTGKVCDSGYKYAGTESVTIGPVVTSPASLTGPDYVCNALSGSYTASAVSGADNYVFSVPSGWKINGVTRTTFTTSSRTVSITAPSSGSGTAQITVRAQKIDACGTTNSSPRPKTISYGGVQTPVISPRNVTVGANSLLTLTANGQGITNFSWIIPGGWNIFSGFNSQQLNVTTSGPAGTYLVQVNALSCGTTVSDYTYVTIDNSNGGFFSRSQVPDVSDVLKRETGGDFLAEKINIYPNPGNQKLNLKISDKTVKITSIAMINMLTGERILARPVDDGTSIDLSNVSAGMYIVNIDTQSGERIQKKVKVVH